MSEDARTPGPVGSPVDRGVRRLPAVVADHIEQRLLTWRQSQMNRSGDRLALDDFMGEDSIADLTNYVCDECALDALPKLTHEQACALHTMLDHYGSDPRMRCLVELLPANMRRDFGA